MTAMLDEHADCWTTTHW